MRSTRAPGPVHRRLRGLAASLAIVAAIAAGCAPGATADGPVAVVEEALDKLADGDLEGLRPLACAGQEEIIREQIGLPGSVGGELLPGLDTEALLDAVRLDVSDVETGEPAIEGDVAQVPVTGDIRVTFDAEAIRPILREALELQGRPMTDDQLDALLSLLEAQGQNVPIDESVRLIREGGAWKICQETIGS